MFILAADFAFECSFIPVLHGTSSKNKNHKSFQNTIKIQNEIFSKRIVPFIRVLNASKLKGFKYGKFALKKPLYILSIHMIKK
jgi:hypothetical protein